MELGTESEESDVYRISFNEITRLTYRPVRDSVKREVQSSLFYLHHLRHRPTDLRRITRSLKRSYKRLGHLHTDRHEKLSYAIRKYCDLASGEAYINYEGPGNNRSKWYDFTYRAAQERKKSTGRGRALPSLRDLDRVFESSEFLEYFIFTNESFAKAQIVYNEDNLLTGVQNPPDVRLIEAGSYNVILHKRRWYQVRIVEANWDGSFRVEIPLRV